MYTINISAIPNQDFETYIDGIRYYFRLHLFRDMLYADVIVEDTEVVRSLRCIDREWMIPFGYKNAGLGNFRFEDDDEGMYPNWERLGKHCNLRFYTNAEIAAMKGGV